MAWLGRGAVMTIVHEPDDERGLCSVVREARDAAAPLRIRGAGTWMDAGRPARDTTTVSTMRMQGVVEYVPGDLVLTVRAGTTLEEIAALTAAHGQWLALDPFGAQGTIGATIATASAGPLSAGFGRVRDLVLGLRTVTGDGETIAAGGRVVKNVAGFDLVRLLTGSWGTLGVITEVSLRLHALPQCDETVAIALGEREGDLAAAVTAVRALPATPMAAQVLDGALATHLFPHRARTAVLLVRLGGNGARVAALRDALAAIGPTETVDASVWARLRGVEASLAASQSPDAPTPPYVLRVSGAPAGSADLHDEVERLCARMELDASICTDPYGGVLRVLLAGSGQVAQLIDALRGGGARVIGERLHPSDWNALPSAVTDSLSAGIRQRFDPVGILNRGILGEATLAPVPDDVSGAFA